jgi:hypothetical protein
MHLEVSDVVLKIISCYLNHSLSFTCNFTESVLHIKT